MNDGLISRKMPAWEKVIWGAIALYLVAVFVVLWIFGFSRLAFPL